MNGSLRKDSYLYAETCSAHDLNVIEARFSDTKWPPPGTAEEREEIFEKETHKTYRCRCWTRQGEECTVFFETHRAGVAHEVHAFRLGSTHGLKLYVTKMRLSNACPMCKTVFSKLITARTHAVQAFRSGRCFMNRSARACDRRKERKQKYVLHVPTQSACSVKKLVC